MGRETYAFYTGLFVLLLGSALVVLSIWLGHYGEERDIYLVTTQGSVSGLNAESTVLYRGVLAGKVADISFDPKDSRNIFVRIEVDRGLPITHGTYARLRVQGLTGLAQIELGDSGENQQPLLTSPDRPAVIPLQPSLVDKLSESGGNILLRAEQLLTHIDELLDKENQGHLRAILANLEAASGHLDRLERRMDEAFAEVHRAATEVKGAGVEIKATGEKAQKTLARLDAFPDDLGRLTAQIHTLAESANALALSGKSATDATAKTTLPKLNAVLEELQTTSAQVRKLTSLLEKDPQAVLYGRPAPEPGPGEPGFKEPTR